MSETVPPRVDGQIDAPNPVELFWERHKGVIIFVALAVVVAIAISYFMQYQDRRAAAERWSTFAAASGLNEAYTSAGPKWQQLQAQIEQQRSQFANNPQFADNPQIQQYLQQQQQQQVSQFFQFQQIELLSALEQSVEQADPDALRAIAEKGDDRAPLALWVLANRAYFDGDFARAEEHLQALEQRFPDHFLTRESDYPVQWRAEVKPPKEKEKPDEDPKGKPKRTGPDLEPAASGSAVALLRKQIEQERAFREAHSELYTPREPTSEQTVVFEIENAGTIKIKLFRDLVPQHTERFLALANDGWWEGQRIHEIRREPAGQAAGGPQPNALVFGWESTKEQDDRTQWQAGEVAEENLVPWEDAPLSHFPGTVAVEPAKEGKSQVERIVITGEDTAERDDGTRVIIGRVVEGLDVVRDIIAGGFADAASAAAGVGKPEDTYTISSVKVE